jgi:hypothetical protein
MVYRDAGGRPLRAPGGHFFFKSLNHVLWTNRFTYMQLSNGLSALSGGSSVGIPSMRSGLRFNHMVGDQASASLLPSARLPTPPINYRGTTSVQCTDVYPNNWLKPLSASIPSSSPSRDTIHVIIRRRCCRMRHHHPVRKSAVGKRLALAPWRLDMGNVLLPCVSRRSNL